MEILKNERIKLFFAKFTMGNYFSKKDDLHQDFITFVQDKEKLLEKLSYNHSLCERGKEISDSEWFKANENRKFYLEILLNQEKISSMLNKDFTIEKSPPKDDLVIDLTEESSSDDTSPEENDSLNKNLIQTDLFTDKSTFLKNEGKIHVNMDLNKSKFKESRDDLVKHFKRMIPNFNEEDMYVYILLLEKNKYYVGSTKDIIKRMKQHIDREASLWTKKYKPLKLLAVLPNDYIKKELNITFGMMKIFGENVRGSSGKYCSIHLTEEITDQINETLENFDSNGEEILKTERRKIPINNGKKWTDEDYSSLAKNVYNKTNLYDISDILGRSPDAIITKLKKIKNFDNISEDSIDAIESFLEEYQEDKDL